MTGSVKNLKLPPLSQVGLVVKDLHASAGYYAETLGIRPWYLVKSPPKEMVYCRGQEVPPEFTIALAFTGNIQLELIQPRDGDRSIYSEHLERGKEGLHHFGYFVWNLDRYLERAQKLGIKPLQWGHIGTRGGLMTRYAYLDTIDACGYIHEVIETKLAGIPWAMSPLQMRLGILLGAVEEIA